jgi:hypothetical protein
MKTKELEKKLRKDFATKGGQAKNAKMTKAEKARHSEKMNKARWSKKAVVKK